jgi:WD40 repeat protein
VKLFDVRDPRHPRQIARLPAGAFHVALSPDGRLLTANTADSLLSWDVSDPRHPHPRPALRLTPGSDVSVSAFRPDGKLIAAGDSSGTIRLFEVDGDRISDEPRSVIHSSSYSGSRPSFSPDGRTLAFVNQGDSSTNPVGPSDERAHVALWDVSDPQSPLQLGGMAYQSSSAITGTAAFSPTGPFLVTTISGAVDLWNTSPKTTIWTLCRTVGDVLQKDEWPRYVPNERYEPPCEQPNVPDPAVTLPTGAQGGR